MARDYIAEMNAAIADAMGEGDIVAPVVAEKLLAGLQETDPDLLDGWLHASAAQFLTMAIGSSDRRERTLVRRRASSRRFAEVAESGDVAALSTFAVRLVVDGDNTRRPIGQMTGSDHRFVAGEYGRSAKTARMLQSFHLAVAKKVGKRKTVEVFSEEQYEQMYRSIVGPEAEAS
ncbi:hypothetical protein [Streptomyces sp.]|uniref:hypothetical protein n=1 Tax=Streptomyces sp. TaxID=1931 RepID=UPI002F94C264